MAVVIIDGSTIRSFVEDEEQFSKSMEDRFTVLDLDGDGVLSRLELRKAFESMRLIEAHFGDDTPSPPEEQLSALYDSIFEQFDIDHSGTIDKEEFKSEMRKILLGIAEGLGNSPIQMVLEGGQDNIFKKAVDLEASKLSS